MGDMNPILQQLAGAANDRARAAILLACPDSVLMTLQEPIRAACRTARFEGGEAFLDFRLYGLRAVRDAHGLLPDRVARAVDEARRAMSRFAAGEEVAEPPG